MQHLLTDEEYRALVPREAYEALQTVLSAKLHVIDALWEVVGSLPTYVQIQIRQRLAIVTNTLDGSLPAKEPYAP